VFRKFNHPIGLITKNALITRDIDLLSDMAKEKLSAVIISMTTLNRQLSRTLEPRTSVPSERLAALEKLANAGIPVGINLAPIIPGLNDEEIPSILKAAYEHGAKLAGHVIVRLPHSVKELFSDWLERNYPEKASRILNRIRDIREGKLSSSEFGVRMSGKGKIAESIHDLFRLSAQKYRLNNSDFKLDYSKFRNPDKTQGELF
jgi:DNA repair photolyase